MKNRGFEVCKGFEELDINLPIRKTKNSVGYDIEAAERGIIYIDEIAKIARKSEYVSITVPSFSLSKVANVPWSLILSYDTSNIKN